MIQGMHDMILKSFKMSIIIAIVMRSPRGALVITSTIFMSKFNVVPKMLKCLMNFSEKRS